MKFRMFTEAISGEKFDYQYKDDEGTTEAVVEVSEPFDIVFSRLNTIAE